MFLSELRIRNFRKFGEIEENGVKGPGIRVDFDKNLNLVVGENDSGKTAIVDAIKHVLLTRSYEYVSVSVDDFHLRPGCSESMRSTNLEVECVFRGFSDSEAKNFIEWLSVDGSGYWLRMFLTASRDGRNVTSEIRAGEGEGAYLDSGARDLLRATYLKPLRDAVSELSPRKGSRISQILDSHEAFAEKEQHPLLTIMKDTNTKLEGYFNRGDPATDPGKKLHGDIDSYLAGFSDRTMPLSSRFAVADVRLKSILEKLELTAVEQQYSATGVGVEPGLGSNNLLFIAAELLLLKKTEYTGLRLGLVEEIEAHLHPQAQLRLVEFLRDEALGSDIQLIMTSHSPVLASKVELSHLVLCQGGQAFPMGESYTLLEKGDYGFLERFLDSTKANMFFAKGVILVEGDAENMLIPAVAEIIGSPLSSYGVTIVKVGSKAFLRYSRIYERKAGVPMDMPVAIVTDLDVRPDEYKELDASAETASDVNIEEARRSKCALYDGARVKTFVSPAWTLEFAIALSPELRWVLLKAILCAQREGNSNRYGVTEEKLVEIDREVDEVERAAESDGQSATEIAFMIYQKYLIDKQVSKATAAQWFAQLLIEERSNCEEHVKGDPALEYLRNAINYAAGKAPR